MNAQNHTTELLDYTTVEIMSFPDKVTSEPTTAVPSFSSTLAPEIPQSVVCPTVPAKVLHSFSSDISLATYLLLHRRLCHVSHDKFKIMCQNQTINGLPKRFSKRLLTNGTSCWICSSAAMTDIPKGIVMNTSILCPGELIHIDFCFINVTSIRGFTCVLMIVDARTRNKCKFATPTKRPPIDILDYFLTQCALEGRPVLKIRTDRGGELAKSSEICELLLVKHKCGLQTTAGYSSWLNGKAESHNKGMTRMLRKSLADADLPHFLWCFALAANNRVYRLHHSATGDSLGI